MSSMFIEDIMPTTTNEDDYKKFYYDESLPLFDRINTIIKKGDSMQRQALINNLNSYVHDSLFSNLIQFIIKDISSWEQESINLFPKSLYYIIIKNTLDNELFNIIFKHMILNITTGADQIKTQYTIYFDKVIEFYRPTKTRYEIYNNINISMEQNFPYKLNDNIFEFILSLGKFGQSSINRRLCCYLSSSLCRLLIKSKETLLEDKNVQRLFERMSLLFEDPDKIIELQMVREIQYVIPLFKDIMFNNKDVILSIECYIKLDWDHIPQTMTIICLLNNIITIENIKSIVDTLFEKIKEILEDKEYEINLKNDIMECLINCLYNNYKLIPKIFNKVLELDIIEYYVNKLFCLETFNIYIKYFDKIYFLMNNSEDGCTTYTENLSEINNNTNLTNNILSQNSTLLTDIKNTSNNNKILFEELFINIYNKLYNQNEISESSSNSLISLEKKETELECKQFLFKYLSNILKCIFIYHKANKQIIDTIVLELFKKENILNILKYYTKEDNENEKFYKEKKNKFYKLLHFLIKSNYKKYINNQNISISTSSSNNFNNNKEFIYENNIYNKLFLFILNNIFSEITEIQKIENNKLSLLIANTLQLLIPKLYKYFKNITIINHNNNNHNYIIANNTVKENNADNKIFYIEKILEEIFNKIIKVIILNKNIGYFIKKEFIKILPCFILYSYNRNYYLDFVREEILKSDNFFIRKFALIYIKQCFKFFSFDFIKKIGIYDDIIELMKDKVNIISTGVINLVYDNVKKIIFYSNDVFHNLCVEIKEIYNINIQNFNHDLKNFDTEKNIIINKILNINESNDLNNNNQENKYFKNDDDEEVNKIKDIENKLITFENDIYNFEKKFRKKSVPKNTENSESSKNSHEITRSIFQRKNSTSTSFQALKSNINISNISNNVYNHIPFNSRVVVKKNTITDKTSNILKSLTSKNINSRHYLPKIKGKRKDSHFSINNDNIYIIKANPQMNNNKIFLNEKDNNKIFNKNKKLMPFSKNRTPSAKTLKANSPINNCNNCTNCDENICKSKTSKKCVSNKNINIILKQNNKTNSISLQKDYNNFFFQGSNKIYINAEKTNTSANTSTTNNK